jgi:hypothetical protein
MVPRATGLHLLGFSVVSTPSPINAGPYLEQFTREMGRSSAPSRSHVDLAWIGFGIGDELGNSLGGERWIDHQYKRTAANAGHWRDVTDEIEI